MRVLHVVSTARRRGAEVFAGDLVRLLGTAGVRQHVAILRGPPSAGVSFECEVTPLSSPKQARGGAVRQSMALRRLVRRWRPDVVHAHGGDPLKVAVLADPRGRTPVVYRNIGLAAPWATRGSRRRLYALLMARAARVVAVAEAVAQESVTTFGVAASRLVTMPNSVDPARVLPRRNGLEVRRDLGVPDGAVVVLTVGALSWEKDPLGQVRVAADVLAAGASAVFLMAGDGPLAADVGADIGRRRLDGRVVLLGPRDDVGDLLGAGDILVLTSRAGGMEGLPAVVIEAGLAGLPVIAFDVAGVSEAIEQGRTGLLVAPGDHEAMAGAVLGLVEDGAARRRLGEEARARCRERFSLDAQLDGYLRLYAEVTARR